MTHDLLQYAAWTRQLARSLVANDGDDVAQDALLSALKRPPDLKEPLEPWLRVVVRNQVFNRSRERQRREAREQRCEVPESAESAEELLARLETHKVLVDVVSELAEPYRRVILLRYFEGLSSAEIGAKENVPPATVRGRLKTAVDALREALDARFGKRALWMPALTELARPAQLAADARPPRDARAPRVSTFGGVGHWILATSLLTVVAATGLVVRHEVVRRATRARETSIAEGDDAPSPASPSAVDHRTLRMLAAMRASDASPARAATPVAASHNVAFERRAALVGVVIVKGTLAAKMIADQKATRDGELASAVVRVTGGASGQFPLPTEALLVTTSALRSHQVQVGRAGQPFVVYNEDDGAVVIRVVQGAATLFEESIPGYGHSPTLAISSATEIVRVAAPARAGDVAFIVPTDNPFAAVTTSQGGFELSGLAPGRYTLETVVPALPSLGTQTLELTTPTESPVVIAFGDGPTPAPVIHGRGPCRIAVAGDSPTRAACKSGGIDAAVKLMKGMIKRSKTRGQKFTCDGCHRDLDTYELTADARDKYKALEAAAR